MAKRIFTSAAMPFTAAAAGAQAVSGSFMNLLGGSTTQILDTLEISISGKVGSSTIGGFVYKRVSTLGTGGNITLAAPHSDGAMNPNATVLVSGSTVVPFVSCTTNQPIPSNTVTDATLNLCINGFGGIYRWNAAPGQQWQSVGNAVTLGSSILCNCTTTSGVTCAADAHIHLRAAVSLKGGPE